MMKTSVCGMRPSVHVCVRRIMIMRMQSGQKWSKHKISLLVSAAARVVIGRIDHVQIGKLALIWKWMFVPDLSRSGRCWHIRRLRERRQQTSANVEMIQAVRVNAPNTSVLPTCTSRCRTAKHVPSLQRRRRCPSVCLGIILAIHGRYHRPSPRFSCPSAMPIWTRLS
jgi:hypothetical protein